MPSWCVQRQLPLSFPQEITQDLKAEILYELKMHISFQIFSIKIMMCVLNIHGEVYLIIVLLDLSCIFSLLWEEADFHFLVFTILWCWGINSTYCPGQRSLQF
jgi:hypothetical protein